MRRLANERCTIVTADRSELDLGDDHAVKDWLGTAKPDVIIILANITTRISLSILAYYFVSYYESSCLVKTEK
mgnify:CR=1 FL=1